VRQVGHLQELY